MDATSWLVAVAALPVWLAPPVLLLWAVTWSRGVRAGFGAALSVALILLYAVLLGWFTDGVPLWAEGVLFWGPVTLAVGGAAWWADHVRSQRTSPAALGTGSAMRRAVGQVLVAGFAGWSVCCGAGLFTPAAEFFGLRLDSPRPGLVLPLPEELTLLSTERTCGSEACSEVYLIGSPDDARPDEVAERLWTHLIDTKGWHRVRDDAGCRDHGWLLRHQFCGLVGDEPGQPDGVLRFLVSGAVTVNPAAAWAGPSVGVGTVGLW